MNDPPCTKTNPGYRLPRLVTLLVHNSKKLSNLFDFGIFLPSWLPAERLSVFDQMFWKIADPFAAICSMTCWSWRFNIIMVWSPPLAPAHRRRT